MLAATACASGSETTEDDGGGGTVAGAGAGVGSTSSGGGGAATSGVGGVGGVGAGGDPTTGAGVGGMTTGVGGMMTAGVGGMTTSGVGGAPTSGSGGMTSSVGSTSGSGGGPVATDACGHALDGPWFEIDYSSAFTATNPAWTYSMTPGWGEPQWAPAGSSWPEVWDLYQNINVSNDPIGKVAVVGPSGVLQIMLGLGGMSSYVSADVCVEGRSVATSSQVIFDVYNPLNNCGYSASMAHDWTVHATSVNLGQCLIPNEDFQAIRLDPTGGSSTLGVMRVTVVLHGAVY